MTPDRREELGRLAYETFGSHRVSYDQNTAPHREMFCRAAEAVYRRALADAAEVARDYGDEGIKAAILRLGESPRC